MSPGPRLTERRLNWAFAIALTLLAGNALVSYSDLIEQARNTPSVVRSREALDHLADLALAIKDAESARLVGLLAPGAANAAFREAESRVRATADRLGRWPARGDDQHRRFARLGRDAVAYVRTLQDARPAPAGLPRPSPIHEAIAAAEADEARFLADRIAERRRWTNRAFLTFSLASTLAFLTIGTAYVFVRRFLAIQSRSEHAAQESEARMRLLFDSVGEGIYGIDTAGRCTFCNPAALRIFGFHAADQVLGRDMHELIHHSHLDGSPFPGHLCPIYRTFRDGEGVLGVEDFFFGADGRPFPVEYRSHAIRRDGLILGAVVTFVDIAPRRRAAAEMRLRDRALRAIGQGVFILDPTRDPPAIVYANGAFERLTGSPKSEWAGRGLELLAIEAPADVEADLRRAVAERRGAAAEFLARSEGGTAAWRSLVLAPIEDARGRVTHLVGVLTDVTEPKRIERDLRAAKDAAEAAIRAKSTFLGNMGHELRTPLNAIIGYSEMLADEATERGIPDLGPDLDRIRAAGHLLLRLVNNVLDLSRIEAGAMQLAVEPFDVADLVRGVVRSAEARAAEQGNTIQVDYASDLGTVRADVFKVSQALTHLLSNALKFTEAGTIIVRARRERDPAGIDWVALTVADDGIGMTRDEQARLFQPFVQADGSAARRFGGTGLGLTITDRYCRMMGGRIDVESGPGRGSTFTMRIPSCAAVAPTRAGGADSATRVDPSGRAGPSRHEAQALRESPAS